MSRGRWNQIVSGVTQTKKMAGNRFSACKHPERMKLFLSQCFHFDFCLQTFFIQVSLRTCFSPSLSLVSRHMFPTRSSRHFSLAIYRFFLCWAVRRKLFHSTMFGLPDVEKILIESDTAGANYVSLCLLRCELLIELAMIRTASSAGTEVDSYQWTFMKSKAFRNEKKVFIQLLINSNFWY